MGKLRHIPVSCLGPQALAQLRAQGIDPTQVGKHKTTFAAKFPQAPAIPVEKYHRSAAEDRTFDGKVFASKLEMAVWRWLVDHGVAFEFQVPIELQPGFEYQGKKIRAINYIADFKFNHPEVLWVDMKGFETPEFKLKWKLLLYRGYEIHKIKSLPSLIMFLQQRGAV